MNIKEIDYEFKDKVIDILERTEILRDDVSYEKIEREGQDDISFLKKLITDLDYCINILNKYVED